MAISEALALVDHVSSPAQKMARAVGTVARRMHDLRAATSGVEKIKAFRGVEKAVGGVRKLEAQAARESAKQERARAAALRKRAAADAKAARQKLVHNKKSGAANKRIAIGTIGIVAALVGVGVAATDAAVRVGELALEFGSAVASAHETRSAAEKMLKALGATDGPKALAAVDKLSLKLGVSLEEGRKQFVDFGKAGKTAVEIAGVMKLRADLVAVTGSAEMADEKMREVLDAPSGGATEKALAKVAKEAGVAGDGVAAASAKMNTFEGFMKRLKDAPVRIFDQLGKTAGPAIDKLGTAANKALDELLRSDEAKAAVGGVVAALSTMLSVATKLAPLIMPFLRGFASGLKPIVSALAPIAKALSKAFGGNGADGMKTAERLGKALAVTLTVIGAVATAIIAPLVLPFVLVAGVLGYVAGKLGAFVATIASAASDFPSLLGRGVERAKAYLMLLQDTAVSAAQNLIGGLTDGITNGVGRVVEAVKLLGAKVKSSLASVLQIKSHSRVMIKFGKHVTGGLAQGITAGSREVAAASASMGGATVSAAGAGAGGGGGGGGAVSLTLNVTAQPGATQQDGEAMAAGIVPVIRRELAGMMRGRALELAGAP